MKRFRPLFVLARRSRALALVLLATGLLVACGEGQGSRAGSAERPLVLGYSSDLQTLNPLVSTDENANELIDHLLFTPLVRYDSAYGVRPWLAESWELGDRKVVFHLRHDVRWHDGRPVTAADVEFTFERAVDPRTASPLAAAFLSNVDSCRQIDDYTVEFTFKGPQTQPLEDFYWPPVPKHLLADVPPAELSRAPYDRHPVGSGPYRFVSWDAGQRLVFSGNPDFPRALGGPPFIGDVVYRIVPEPTTLLREFLSGAVDIDGPLGPEDAGRVERAKGVRLEAFPWRQFTYIGWNIKSPLFADARVRRALTLAIDRPTLLKVVLHGHGSLATGVIPTWHRLSPGLAPLPYAPDSAAALLARAGWRDTDGDGILDKDGVPFHFVLLANQRNPIYGDIAQIVQADLARVGISMEPRLLEWQTVLSMHRARNFEAVLTNWVLDNFRVDPRPLFHSSQIAIKGSANRSSYSNPVADSLMDLGARTTDEREAARIWAELSRVIQQDQPFTFLFWNDELAGVSDRLTGVRMDARGELVTLPRWRWAGSSP